MNPKDPFFDGTYKQRKKHILKGNYDNTLHYTSSSFQGCKEEELRKQN